MKRLAAHLASSVRALRAMQFPGGELPAVYWSESGEAYSAPAPLLSALAHDALAFLDPRSPLFIGRLRDLVPSSFFTDVVSLRWGLRLSIASEQSADGTWQLHGRLGARRADVATTACAAAAMLPNVKWRRARPDARAYTALRRLDSRAWSPLEAAHALRYYALIGAEDGPLATRLEAEPELSIAARHVTTSLRGVDAGELQKPRGPLEDALRTAALLDGGSVDAGPLEKVLTQTTPPWRWPADPYGDHRLGSPATALAIQLSNVARFVALHGEAS